VTSGIWLGDDKEARECKIAPQQVHNTLSIYVATFNKRVIEGPIYNHYFENFTRVVISGRSRSSGGTIALMGTALQTEASICAEPDDPNPDATLKIYIPSELFVYSGSEVPLYTDVLNKIPDDVLKRMFAVSTLSSDKEFVFFNVQKTYGEFENGGVRTKSKADGVLFTLALNKKGATAGVAGAMAVSAAREPVRDQIGLTKAAQKALRECVKGKKIPKKRKILKKGSKSVRCKK
jgi:hypothetical protein